MTSKLEQRITALESAPKSEMDDALQSVIDRYDWSNQQVINKLAHEAVKHALAAFPQHAQDHVISLFNAKMKAAESYGYQKYSHMSTGALADRDEPPTIDDLFAD